MRKNRNKLAISAQSLVVLACFIAGSVQASVINLTWSEDSTSFISTWRIDDNGGSDFSGTDSVTGTYWEVGLTSDASAVLQDAVAHILGPHGESFLSSSFDYGALPSSYYELSSFVVHPNGHRDDYTMTSDFVDGGFNISFAGVHAIPIPAAVWLFGSGLGLLGWFRRRT